MSVGTVVSVVFPLLTLIIGGACLLLLSVTTTLRANNGDLKDRVDLLEKDLAQEKLDNAALKAEVGALQKVVTGEVQLAAIETHVVALDRTTTAGLARIEKGIDQVRADIKGLSE